MGRLFTSDHFCVIVIYMNSGHRRQYRMSARADSAEETRQRILTSAVDLFWEDPGTSFTLTRVADRAGVAPVTVIRLFGGVDGVFAAAAQQESERIRVQRDSATADDPRRALTTLVDHYEEFGDGVIRMLAEEHHRAGLAQLVDGGRRYHHEWCARVFVRVLSGVGHGRRLAQLVSICDVYTWKLMRRDLGLSRDETELAMWELVDSIARESQ